MLKFKHLLFTIILCISDMALHAQEKITLNEAIEIFSKHQDYADEDEMKRGAYLREYQALLSYLDR